MQGLQHFFALAVLQQLPRSTKDCHDVPNLWNGIHSNIHELNRNLGSSFDKDRLSAQEFFDLVATQCSIPRDAFKNGIGEILDQLTDTAVDVPFAPKLVGVFSESQHNCFANSILSSCISALLYPRKLLTIVLHLSYSPCSARVEAQLRKWASDLDCFMPQVGDLIGSLVAKDVLELGSVGKSILGAGNEDSQEGEDAQLIDSGFGLNVIAASLKQLEAHSTPETALNAWKGQSLHIESFIASVSHPKKHTMLCTQYRAFHDERPRALIIKGIFFSLPCRKLISLPPSWGACVFAGV